MTRTCQAPAGDVPAHAPLTARLCGRPATTSAVVEGVTFDLCASCARELTMIDLTEFARPDESCAAAIARAVSEGRRLCSYESPTEEAREGLTAAEAEKIAAEDPGLVRVEADRARDARLASELTREGQAQGEYDPPVLLLARAVVGPASGSRCPVEIQRTDRGVTVRLDGEEEGQPDLKWEGAWSEWTAALCDAMGAPRPLTPERSAVLQQDACARGRARRLARRAELLAAGLAEAEEEARIEREREVRS